MAITMMRSRFQPFTKGHYEAIRSYYLARKERSNLPEKLVLCIIRDFDTVRMTRPLVGDKLVTGAETPDELALLFRHLDFFNPFSAYEVIEQIRHSLHCFATEDELTYCDPDYEKFVDNIGVILCPLKFGELLEALKRECFVPRHLERHVNSVRNRVLEVLQQQKDVESSLQKKLNQAFEDSKEELIYNVLNTWARLAKDLLPKEPYSQVYWLMPIFDQEDLEDFKIISSDFTAYYIIMDEYKYDCILELLGRGSVGLYGFFMEYIILGLVERRVITLDAASSGGWGESIRTQKDKLSKLLCPHWFDQYQTNVEMKLNLMRLILGQLQDWSVLETTSWDEKYVQQLQDLRAGPYVVLIGLMNFLIRSRFEEVMRQIFYPDNSSLEGLDDQFKIPLKRMSDNIVGWLRAAIDRHRSESLTNGQRKALGKVNQLAKKIEKEGLENRIRQQDCLSDYRRLAEAVRDLRVEDINQLTRKITETLRRG